MKDVYDCETVKRLFKSGMKIKAIARTLNMSKNTVKKLIKAEGAPRYNREYYKTKTDEYEDQITKWYLEDDFNGTRIFRELKKHGYDGSINPIYRCLKKLADQKSEISKAACERIETPYGDQAQFDWSPYKMVIGSNLIEVNCMTMILSASRKKAGVFSKNVDADSVYEAIQELFEDLGGVTRELLIDNPKTLVLANNKGHEVIFNRSALNLSFHLGTELNACAPYRARTKGKIEKPYQYIEEQFVKGSRFDSLEHLNKEFKIFLEEFNENVHGTTKRKPNEMFLEEAQHLLPIPNKRYLHQSLQERIVSNDCYVSVDTNRYSVPAKYVGKSVKVRKVYGYKLEIYSKEMQLIFTHNLVEGKNEVKKTEEHYDAIKAKAPKSIPEIRRQFVKSFSCGQVYLNRTSKILTQQSYHMREFLKLKELYSNHDLELILSYCINNEIYRIEGIKEVLKDKYFEIVLEEKSIDKSNIAEAEFNSKDLAPDGLIRDTSYYEGGQN
ncbi:transposase [Desulfitispora alkaliphila]|uniref:IS21 family transposase n=1 Tax=Desulfitispora alkaliphila TaxID=622674 RepID=UPI003D239128